MAPRPSRRTSIFPLYYAHEFQTTGDPTVGLCSGLRMCGFRADAVASPLRQSEVRMCSFRDDLPRIPAGDEAELEVIVSCLSDLGHVATMRRVEGEKSLRSERLI